MRIRLLMSLDRLREKALMALAWGLPSGVAYWAAIRVGAHATQGRWSDQEVPALLFIDALKRWEDRR